MDKFSTQDDIMSTEGNILTRSCTFEEEDQDAELIAAVNHYEQPQTVQYSVKPYEKESRTSEKLLFLLSFLVLLLSFWLGDFVYSEYLKTKQQANTLIMVQQHMDTMLNKVNEAVNNLQSVQTQLHSI